jgi:hypothetical protein
MKLRNLILMRQQHVSSEVFRAKQMMTDEIASAMLLDGLICPV